MKLRASNNPPKENTLRKIASGLRTLNKSIGALPLSEVKNGAAKRYVAERVAARASGSTIDGEFYILRKVVASQVTEEGEQIFPVTWNAGFPRPSRHEAVEGSHQDCNATTDRGCNRSGS